MNLHIRRELCIKVEIIVVCWAWICAKFSIICKSTLCSSAFSSWSLIDIFHLPLLIVQLQLHHSISLQVLWILLKLFVENWWFRPIEKFTELFSPEYRMSVTTLDKFCYKKKAEWNKFFATRLHNLNNWYPPTKLTFSSVNYEGRISAIFNLKYSRKI